MTKINIEALVKEVERDLANHKFCIDGRNYEVTEDYEGIKEIKKILNIKGFDVISSLTGYRNGSRCITLLVSIKR